MEFWYWYWSGIKKMISLKWVKHPAAEYSFVIITTGGLVIFLSIHVTPLWLILVLPIGITASIHSLWRWNKKIDC